MNEWKWSKEVDILLARYQDKFCECGCGQKLNPSRKQVRDSKSKNKPLRVLKGHHNRLPEATWIKGGEEHTFYGKKHKPESLKKMRKTWFSSGEYHPDWKGGVTKLFPFRRGWLTIRRKVLARYGNKCKHCGIESGGLHIHHLVGRRNFETASEAHNINNLIPLCKGCHLTLENRLRAMKNGMNSANTPKG